MVGRSLSAAAIVRLGWAGVNGASAAQHLRSLGITAGAGRASPAQGR